jgi:hypothetical protein
MMIATAPVPPVATTPADQGRARGLYDEQLQRKQQEKALARGGLPGVGSAFFKLDAPVVRASAGKSS